MLSFASVTHLSLLHSHKLQRLALNAKTVAHKGVYPENAMKIQAVKLKNNERKNKAVVISL